MRVRLIKKFAEMIDGIDLSGRSVGDVLNLTPSEGKLLIAEEWAVRGEGADRARSDRSSSKKRESSRSTRLNHSRNSH